MNAMASGHPGLHHGLGYGRSGFAHGTLRDWPDGCGSAYRVYGGHYGALSRWGFGLGLGVFGYDDRYCSPSYHACEVYGR